VIKRLWTSSYVLVAGGYSAMLLGLFYLVVDIRQYRQWARPFIWIGANPLVIYMAGEFVRFHSMGERVVGGPIAALFGAYGELLVVATSIVFVLLFARFLYNRKLFLRV
jgi:predicted acyltransferase